MTDSALAYRRRWPALAVLCLTVFVVVIDNTVISLALPTLAKPPAAGGLAATTSQLQWIVDSYALVFAGLLLVAGSLGDRFGRARALAWGLAVFGVGSLLSAFAASPWVLVLTRGLMGIGGAFAVPATLSILRNLFTDPVERRKAIGVWAGCAGFGAFGSVVGGVLMAHFWWGSVFLVNVPVVLVALLAGRVLVPESRDPSSPPIDVVGALLSTVAFGALLWAIIEAPGHGWGSSRILAAFTVGAAVLVAFLAWEARCRHPMLDLQLFRDPRFSTAGAAVALTFLALFGVMFAVTQYLQLVLGYSTLGAGLLMLPQGVVLLTASPMSTMFVRRYGTKLVVAGGLLAVACALALLQTYDADTGTVQLVLVSLVLAAGMAHVAAPATDSIVTSLPPAKSGAGSAVNGATRQMGGAVGIAVFGSLLAARFSSGMAAMLDGTVPADVVDRVKAGLGQAMGAAADDPRVAPYADRIVEAAHVSFISALHLVAAIAAALMVLIAVGVLAWLPARPTEIAVDEEAAEAAELVPVAVEPAL